MSRHSLSCPTSALTEAAIVVSHDDVLELLVDGQLLQRRVSGMCAVGRETAFEIKPFDGSPKSVELIRIKEKN